MGGGIVRDFGMDMDTLLCLTWRTSKDLLDSTGDSAQSSVITLWFPGGRMGEGIVREFWIYMYTLLYLKWRTNKDLLYSTGNSAQYSVITLWFPGRGRDSQGAWDGHGHTAVFNMENQQGPAGQHRELGSMSCGSLDGRGVWGRMDTFNVRLSPFAFHRKLQQCC